MNTYAYATKLSLHATYTDVHTVKRKLKNIGRHIQLYELCTRMMMIKLDCLRE